MTEARIRTARPEQISEICLPTAPLLRYLEFPEVPANAPEKPNKQYYVAAMLEGTPVGIRARRHYETFFKLFQRACTYERKKLKLTCRQVAPDLWLLIPRKPSDPKPDTMLESGWREHGKYKVFARALHRGESVDVRGEKEAAKVRRAWMLYYNPEQRKHRQCTIELCGRGKYRLQLICG